MVLIDCARQTPLWIASSTHYQKTCTTSRVKDPIREPRDFLRSQAHTYISLQLEMAETIAKATSPAATENATAEDVKTTETAIADGDNAKGNAPALIADDAMRSNRLVDS